MAEVKVVTWRNEELQLGAEHAKSIDAEAQRWRDAVQQEEALLEAAELTDSEAQKYADAIDEMVQILGIGKQVAAIREVDAARLQRIRQVVEHRQRHAKLKGGR